MTKAVLVYQRDGENEPRVEKFDDIGKFERKVKLLKKVNEDFKEEIFKGIIWNVYNEGDNND